MFIPMPLLLLMRTHIYSYMFFDYILNLLLVVSFMHQDLNVFLYCGLFLHLFVKRFGVIHYAMVHACM